MKWKIFIRKDQQRQKLILERSDKINKPQQE